MTLHYTTQPYTCWRAPEHEPAQAIIAGPCKYKDVASILWSAYNGARRWGEEEIKFHDGAQTGWKNPINTCEEFIEFKQVIIQGIFTGIVKSYRRNRLKLWVMGRRNAFCPQHITCTTLLEGLDWKQQASGRPEISTTKGNCIHYHC